ncbi:unnamed protein product [Prorocentrum cordatum]|uniref:Uncharacterized protein n=1 Tax=Prorocentrum cordatum TaxID=2364126 RepID=A0ABN9WD13_9DINO|nr:unnamed protein product [Polarella glacialis]
MQEPAGTAGQSSSETRHGDPSAREAPAGQEGAGADTSTGFRSRAEFLGRPWDPLPLTCEACLGRGRGRRQRVCGADFQEIRAALRKTAPAPLLACSSRLARSEHEGTRRMQRGGVRHSTARRAPSRRVRRVQPRG